MKPYQIFVRLEAVEALRSIRANERKRVAAFIDSLAREPLQRGDYREKDDTRREIEIKIIGRHAVTYWADHAVAEVKVTDIRDAD